MNKEAILAMDAINKMFTDSNLVIRLGDSKSMDVQRTEVGRLAIDIPTGGGFPDGRIIEFYGKESSGKTTAALHALESHKRKHPEKEVAFIDFEHAFDAVYAKSLGVITDDLLVSQPMYAEQGLDAVIKMAESGGFSLIVVDSVAAMSPKSEIEGDMGKTPVGLHARLMSQAMRKLAGVANKTKTTVIFINQLREKIGVMFGNPDVTTGGNALKFYSSIRIEFYRGAQTKDSDKDVVGNRGRIKVVKNKTYAPYKEAEFDIEFGKGISQAGSILDYGVQNGIIKQSGSWYSYGDTKLGQGRDSVKNILEDNPELSEELHKLIMEKEFEKL